MDAVTNRTVFHIYQLRTSTNHGAGPAASAGAGDAGAGRLSELGTSLSSNTTLGTAAGRTGDAIPQGTMDSDRVFNYPSIAMSLTNFQSNRNEPTIHGFTQHVHRNGLSYRRLTNHWWLLE